MRTFMGSWCILYHFPSLVPLAPAIWVCPLRLAPSLTLLTHHFIQTSTCILFVFLQYTQQINQIVPQITMLRYLIYWQCIQLFVLFMALVSCNPPVLNKGRKFLRKLTHSLSLSLLAVATYFVNLLKHINVIKTSIEHVPPLFKRAKFKLFQCTDVFPD